MKNSGQFKKGKYMGFGFKKGQAPWNKGKKGTHFSKKTEFKKGAVPWNVGIPISQKVKDALTKANKGKRRSIKTEFKKGQTPFNKGKKHMEDEKHPGWKGDGVGYGALHTWIHRKLGKAKRCDRFGCKYPRINAAKKILREPKTFQWANISHKYKRDFSDWIQLCASCHARYDKGLVKL